ncbi:MAG: hypothetical protein KC708_20890 [Anaerolineae bacterium]|nr:hypothetical protein [Anaerolineae bacterium]
MNHYMQEKWSWIEGSHAMRIILLDTLNDADLAFNPGGQAMTLGALCREMGEIEYSYIWSLKTFKQDWSYRNTQAQLDTRIAKLKAWYQELDEQLKAVVSAFSDEDLKKSVERYVDNQVPIEMQLDIYLQAVLIFLGKVTIYLKAMNKALPDVVSQYIG